MHKLLPHRGKKYKKRNLKTRKSIEDHSSVVAEKPEIGIGKEIPLKAKGIKEE